ncbi:MAG: LacI family transcriptional regulator [Roseburia sp.]|nr:LacI family transcriptional regulator [Roseburia sp.]MCM1278630.1 LacI family transcriptional regulator [Robinsoniella sp.]
MEQVTIKDIARICGVGISTVSRAINNHPDINPETKSMINRVIREQGYVPNNSARNLKRTEAKTIAVLVKGMNNPFFTSMVKSIEKEIKKKKYAMVLHHVEHDEDEIDVALELVKEKRLKGIIFLGGYFQHSSEKLGYLNVPFILSTVGGSAETIDKAMFSTISVDDRKESYRIVDYLIQSGHKKIAMISASKEDESIGKLRLEGYKKALKEHGISFRQELVRPMDQDLELYSMENGYQATKQLLASGEEFTALYAISDMMAVGALRAIHEAGKKVPDDYSVVGYDGIDIGKYSIPTITTVHQPIEEMAKETIGLLFDIISGKKQHQHRVFSGEIVVRESTKSIKE